MSCCRRCSRWFWVLTLVFCIGWSFNALAQSDDSIYHRFNPTWTRYYYLNHIDQSQVIDTSTDLVHRYHQGFDEFNEMQTGNLGQASFRLSPQFVQHVGYRVGLDAYSEYFFTPDNTPFYNTRRPYTVLDYVLGTKNEQMFSGTHTQNITKQYNFNFRFQRIGSQGIFSRQRADWFNLSLGQSFTTKNQRYYIQALVHQNRAKLQQNGGITIPLDSAYNSVYLDRNSVPVRLDSALLTMRERGVFVQHGLQWGGYYEHKFDTTVQKILYPVVRLQHRFEYNRFRYKFHDDVVDFPQYENVYIDGSKTNDSIQYDSWRNELRLELTDIRSKTDTTTSCKLFGGGVGLTHELYQFFEITSGPSLDNKSNVIAKADVHTNFLSAELLQGNILRNLNFGASGEYDVAGYNQSDYTLTSYASLNVGPITPSFFYRRSSLSPTHFQEYYNGNHFQWTNVFGNTNTTIYGGSLFVKPARGFISYSIYNVTNPIYFSENRKPAQLLSTVNGYSFSVAPSFALGHFHLDARLVWQSYDNAVLTYPDFYTLSSLYYTGKLFKSALQMTAGVEGRYNTSYDAPSFEPNTSQFYVQHETEAGDYMWLDAFLNLKIRSVRVSLLGQNLLQGTSKVNTYSAMPYPLPDRSFKVRINWLFWN